MALVAAMEAIDVFPHDVVSGWLANNGFPPSWVYRIEIHMEDRVFVRVFQYATDENGSTYFDEATGDVARLSPVDI